MQTITWLSKQWMETIKTPSVVISIGDPKEDLPNFGCDHIDVLRLEFDDVEEDLGPEYVMFDWTMARKILQFEQRYKDHDIIVHCHAGISRSVAVALRLAILTKRILSLEHPCSGATKDFNKWVYRQLFLTHTDLLASGFYKESK